MAEPAPDPLAAWLAEAREDVRHLARIKTASWTTGPLIERVIGHADGLLAALDRVLALAAEWRAEAASLDERAGLAADAGDSTRSATLSYRAQAHTDCAEQLGEAIRAALLGEEATGA